MSRACVISPCTSRACNSGHGDTCMISERVFNLASIPPHRYIGSPSSTP
jgi:hypothetical protein